MSSTTPPKDKPLPSTKEMLLDKSLCFVRDENNRVNDICELIALFPRTKEVSVPVFVQLRFNHANLDFDGTVVSVGVRRAVLSIQCPGYVILPIDKFGDIPRTPQTVSETVEARKMKSETTNSDNTKGGSLSTLAAKGNMQKKKGRGNKNEVEKTLTLRTESSQSPVKPMTGNRWEILYPTTPKKMLDDLFINFDELCFLSKKEKRNNYDVTLDVQVHQKDFIFHVEEQPKKFKLIVFKILCHSSKFIKNRNDYYDQITTQAHGLRF
jgi:hypothetical protein